jgi:hypothetical protein
MFWMDCNVALWMRDFHSSHEILGAEAGVGLGQRGQRDWS